MHDIIRAESDMIITPVTSLQVLQQPTAFDALEEPALEIPISCIFSPFHTRKFPPPAQRHAARRASACRRGRVLSPPDLPASPPHRRLPSPDRLPVLVTARGLHLPPAYIRTFEIYESRWTRRVPTLCLFCMIFTHFWSIDAHSWCLRPEDWRGGDAFGAGTRLLSRSCLGREIVISNALHCPGTMMAMSTLPHLAGIACQSRCSPAVARIQYGLPRRQITRVRALATSSSLKTTLTPSKLSFNPFRPGESLGVSCSPKAVPVRRRAPVQRISAQAADASASDGGESEETAKVGDVAIPKPAMGRLKIGVYFATWWALNVVFNIYNKKVLNAYPFPWLTSTLSLLAGSTIMILSWVLRIVPAPDVDADFWKGLAPVALAHTIGHVAATVSMSKVAVSFTHIIKSAEPAFSVIIQRLFLGEHFSLPVYLSLVPIVGGCGLAAATELNFNMTGFVGAMISNIAFVFRNIFSKKGMTTGKSVGGMNYYACLSMMSLVFLTPFAIAVEGPKAWVSGWDAANLAVGPRIFWWVVAQSVFYHLYNQVSYMSLNEISPLTFSIGNTMKRVTVIVSSIIIFHTQVRPINAVGAAIAIIGTFLYSQAKQ